MIFKHSVYQCRSFVSSSHCFISPQSFPPLPRRDVKDVFLGLDSTGEGTISLSDARLLKKDVVVDGILLKGQLLSISLEKG